MPRHVQRSLRQERLMATLSTAFGLTALFLVSIGLYGVIAQWAAQRTREIGVRMALGATAAACAGWSCARRFSWFSQALLSAFPPQPRRRVCSRECSSASRQWIHPLALAGTVLFAVASLAAYLPARRASRVDPMGHRKFKKPIGARQIGPLTPDPSPSAPRASPLATLLAPPAPPGAAAKTYTFCRGVGKVKEEGANQIETLLSYKVN